MHFRRALSPMVSRAPQRLFFYQPSAASPLGFVLFIAARRLKCPCNGFNEGRVISAGFSKSGTRAAKFWGEVESFDGVMNLCGEGGFLGKGLLVSLGSWFLIESLSIRMRERVCLGRGIHFFGALFGSLDFMVFWKNNCSLLIVVFVTY